MSMLSEVFAYVHLYTAPCKPAKSRRRNGRGMTQKVKLTDVPGYDRRFRKGSPCFCWGTA